MVRPPASCVSTVMHRIGNGLRIVVVVAACLAASGCLFRDPPPPTAVSYRTTARAAKPMRVAVLPSTQAAGVSRSALVVDEALAAGLRELARHEVVAIDRATAIRLLPGDPLYANRIDAAALLALRDAVGADAVLVTRVERFTTYDPCSLALTAHLIDCGDGSILWSATAHLDGQRAEVQEDLRLWHDRLQGDALPDVGGWRTDLISPSRFARYACDRMLGTLDPEVRRTVLRIPIIGVVL
jgi:hypothetical protein